MDTTKQTAEQTAEAERATPMRKAEKFTPGPWLDCGEDMTRDVSAELRRRGIPHSPAQYDAGGNCLTCGECGRCPGVHTFEEIQRADRAQKGIAR
jgi:hypothetical protein